MKSTTAVTILALAGTALADFQLQIVAANGQYEGTYVSAYRIGAGTYFAIGGSSSSSGAATFTFSNGNLAQTQLSPPFQAGSINGYFTASTGFVPLSLGVGGVNQTFSLVTKGSYPSPQLAFNGNSNWYICSSSNGFGRNITGTVNLAMDSSTAVGDCQGVLLIAQNATVTSATSSATATATSTSTSTANSINGQFAISVSGSGVPAGQYLGYAHVGAAQNFGILSSSVYPFTLVNGQAALQNLGYPGTLALLNNTGTTPLFIGVTGGINATFSVDSKKRLLANGLDKWRLCSSQSFVGYTYSKVISFEFTNSTTTACTKVELNIVQGNSTTVTTSYGTVTKTPCPTCRLVTTALPAATITTISGTAITQGSSATKGSTLHQYTAGSSASKLNIGIASFLSVVAGLVVAM